MTWRSAAEPNIMINISKIYVSVEIDFVVAPYSTYFYVTLHRHTRIDDDLCRPSSLYV